MNMQGLQLRTRAHESWDGDQVNVGGGAQWGRWTAARSQVSIGRMRCVLSLSGGLACLVTRFFHDVR